MCFVSVGRAYSLYCECRRNCQKLSETEACCLSFCRPSARHGESSRSYGTLMPCWQTMSGAIACRRTAGAEQRFGGTFWFVVWDRERVVRAGQAEGCGVRPFGAHSDVQSCKGAWRCCDAKQQGCVWLGMHAFAFCLLSCCSANACIALCAWAVLAQGAWANHKASSNISRLFVFLCRRRIVSPRFSFA